MATPSFSLLLSNLFVALSKQSKVLSPYSKDFGGVLGYQVFMFEPVIRLSGRGTSHPDLVVTSKKVGCTLVLEWTERTTVDSQKAGQLHRYSSVTQSDLVNVLGVPVDCAKLNNIALITGRNGCAAFGKFLMDSALVFPLLSFTIDGDEHNLKLEINAFREPSTHRFFNEGIVARNVPLRYIPFSLDQIRGEELVSLVIQHLLSLIVKDVKSFTITEFCAGCYLHAWNFIGVKKQSEISRKTKTILQRLTQKKMGFVPIKRIGDNPPEWEVVYDSAYLNQRMRSVRKLLTEFVAEVEGRPFQEMLPFE